MSHDRLVGMRPNMIMVRFSYEFSAEKLKILTFSYKNNTNFLILHACKICGGKSILAESTILKQ